MIQKITKIFHRILAAKQPSFIISYMYLIKPKNDYIKIHRAIFLKSFSRLDLAVINILASLRWIGYYAWISCYKTATKTTTEQLNQAACKNRFFLFLKLLKLSLANFITPIYYFRYKLYHHNPFEFFYSKENSPLHIYSDRNINNSKNDARLISDKYAFLQFLEKQNIQINHSNKTSINQILAHPEIIFKKQKIFCKPNIANRSTGALCLNYNNSEYQLITLVDKKIVTGKSAILKFLETYYAKNQQILIERFFEDDNYIKDLSRHPTDTTTMRIITASIQTTKLEPQAIYAQLEIPRLENNNKQQFYNILPLNINTLDIDLTNISELDYKVKFENIKFPETLKQKIKAAINKCIKAHEQLNIRAIAFDVILSPNDAVIIEANYNWDIEILYRAFGHNNKDHIAKLWLENL
ncbi:hypothetical protein [Francisella tularensis]|uniref:hypothetical protein n=1 Tax=Francisella tularensis TaxID=263 RepID=UPI0008F4C4FB|nr:hypothetical protein [Francisella tularensis]APA83025.1 hypothetical protein N894_1041 [Francisella tularensis subsp. novicida PA10-7858]